MAINTLFKDIADAIREKAGTSGLITPAQMPQAIADISGGGGVLLGTTTPTAEQGSDGDIYAKYVNSYSDIEFTINILTALRGTASLSYAGASELDIIFENANHEQISMRAQSGFIYRASGGTASYAFDNNTASYWEASPTPIWMKMSATIPAGYKPITLKAMQRSTNYTSDVWQSFNVTAAGIILCEHEDLTVSDWAGANNYTDFSLNASSYLVTNVYLKIEGQWIEQNKIVVNVEV